MTENLMPNVAGNMLYADYWIQKLDHQNDIIMDIQQIHGFNRRIEKNPETKTYNLKSYPDNLSGSRIVSYINEYPFPVTDRFCRGVKVGGDYYEKIKININSKSITASVRMMYAFTVKRTDVRSFPVADESLIKKDDIAFDQFQETALEFAEPIIVLHKSYDGKWLFVQSANYRGWIKKQDAAIAENRRQWLKYLEAPEFVVVTGNRVTTAMDLFFRDSAGLDLGMGTKLPLAAKDKIPQPADQKILAANFTVQIPARNKDGSLVYKMIWIPKTADVVTGYLPYNRTNIIKQAFKMLGDRYGWGGMSNRRDCSSFVCDLYKCFGIVLPRNSSRLAISAGKTIVFNNAVLESRRRSILSCKTGALLFMKGHVMLYLGENNGRPYIIHSVYSYDDKDTHESDRPIGRKIVNAVVVSDLNIPKGGNGKTLMENCTVMKQIE